jgi:hypothetical protein
MKKTVASCSRSAFGFLTPQNGAIAPRKFKNLRVSLLLGRQALALQFIQ